MGMGRKEKISKNLGWILSQSYSEGGNKATVPGCSLKLPSWLAASMGTWAVQEGPDLSCWPASPGPASPGPSQGQVAPLASKCHIVFLQEQHRHTTWAQIRLKWEGIQGRLQAGPELSCPQPSCQALWLSLSSYTRNTAPGVISKTGQVVKLVAYQPNT